MENINIRTSTPWNWILVGKQYLSVLQSTVTPQGQDPGVDIARTQGLFTVYAHCLLSRIELFLKMLPLNPALLVSLQHCMTISNNFPLADFHSNEWSLLIILWHMLSQSLVLMFPATPRVYFWNISLMAPWGADTIQREEQKGNCVCVDESTIPKILHPQTRQVSWR